MRVCILTTGFPRFEGDLFGAFVLEMARALVEEGTQVTVVAPHEHGLPRKEQVDGIDVYRFRYFIPSRLQAVAYGGGIPTNVRASWLTRIQIPLFLLSFSWAARHRGRHCDLYHCQWTMTALVAWLASIGRRRPILLSVRGSDMMLSDHPLGRRLNTWIASKADAITAVSTQIATRLAEHGAAAKTHIVANGVSERFCPGDSGQARARLDLPADAVIGLFVGMLVPVKGLTYLLEAMEQIDDERFVCVLVGDGPERDALETQAAGFGDRVLFAGARSSAEIPDWMTACDFLVLPSLSEGRPNVVLEAHASGRTALATDVGGTGELIEHDRTGWLIPPKDTSALADGLRTLIADPDLRLRLGQSARQELVDRGLTWAGTANQMLSLYEQLRKERVCAASPAS